MSRGWVIGTVVGATLLCAGAAIHVSQDEEQPAPRRARTSVLAPAPTSDTAPRKVPAVVHKPGITMQEFSQLRLGMTKSDGFATANAMFQDGRLISKTQVGL
jgi:hypothetical protein